MESDGLNAASLPCCEFLSRRQMSLETAHRDDPEKPAFEGSHIYKGEDEEGTGASVTPAFRAHVASELSRGHAIEKEKRKAREAKATAGAGETRNAVTPLRQIMLARDPQVDLGSTRVRAGASRTARRRSTCRRLALDDANDMVAALNALYGCERDALRLSFWDLELIMEVMVLDVDARRVFTNFDNFILASPDVVSERRERAASRPYFDVTSRADKKAYVDFLRRLKDRRLLGVASESLSLVTPFFVAKKKGKQRLALDWRLANTLFAHATTVEIGSSEARFYQCGGVGKLSNYFCLPSVSVDVALELGLAVDIRGQGRAHMEMLRRAAVPGDRIALGAKPLPPLTSGPVELPYSDKINVLGVKADEVTELRDRVVARFSDEGFSMHEISVASVHSTILGADLWVLRGALQWLASGPIVTGRQVEVVVGHCVAAALFNRAGMSVPRALYGFIRDRYLRPCRLWRSCRCETWIFSAVAALLGAQLDRPLSPTVTATDASTTGFGVCEKKLDSSEVSELGKWHEKWRFKRLQPEEWAPRRRALDDFPGITDPATVLANNVIDGWAEVAGFPEAPRHVLHKEGWRVIYKGPYRYVEHIGLKEVRAMIWALRRLAKDPSQHHHRHLFLLDNFGVCCCSDRGRPPSYCMLQLNRRLAALSLAANISPHFRWIPSEWQPADKASRTFEGLSPEPQSSPARSPRPTSVPRPKRRRLGTAAVAEGLVRTPGGLGGRRAPLHARLAKALEPNRSSPASAMALSKCELAAAVDATRAGHRAYSDAFQVLLAEEGGLPSTTEDMEVRVLQFRDLRLEAECARADATILVAAVRGACPWCTGSQSMPRVASTVLTYIRPGALRKIQVRQLLAPSRASGQLQCWSLILAPAQMEAGAPGDPRGSQREPTKTGTSDETVILDHPAGLGERLAASVRGGAPADLIFPTPGAFVAPQFGIAAAKCGLPRVCLYQLLRQLLNALHPASRDFGRQKFVLRGSLSQRTATPEAIPQ
ncbi:unnamed protein product [Prorocentrum cordatum]|uniref:Uncharacterized protein n=1 Tax=Prorocentrum cordatum TaxID=2364126 RepID=A0ABN9TAA2_9DINO|nr:unnamed protein product [Polarella glacialis]